MIQSSLTFCLPFPGNAFALLLLTPKVKWMDVSTTDGNPSDPLGFSSGIGSWNLSASEKNQSQLEVDLSQFSSSHIVHYFEYKEVLPCKANEEQFQVTRCLSFHHRAFSQWFRVPSRESYLGNLFHESFLLWAEWQRQNHQFLCSPKCWLKYYHSLCLCEFDVFCELLRALEVLLW